MDGICQRVFVRSLRASLGIELLLSTLYIVCIGRKLQICCTFIRCFELSLQLRVRWVKESARKRIIRCMSASAMYVNGLIFILNRFTFRNTALALCDVNTNKCSSQYSGWILIPYSISWYPPHTSTAKWQRQQLRQRQLLTHTNPF